MNTIIFDHMVNCIDKKKYESSVREMIENGAHPARACYMSTPTCINPNYYFTADYLSSEYGYCTGADISIVDAWTNETIFHGGYYIIFDKPIPYTPCD